MYELSIAPVGGYIYQDVNALLYPALVRSVMSSESNHIQRCRIMGALTGTFDDVLGLVKRHGGRIVWDSSVNTYRHTFFAWPDASYMDVELSNEAFTATGLGLNDRLGALMGELKERVQEGPTKPVYAIGQGSNGPALISVGGGQHALERANYSEEVLAGTDYAVSEFRKKCPSGRIVILSGPPGTGKTHLVRGLIGQIDAIFILVPPIMTGELDKPQLVSLIVGQKSTRPVVLIIEDGDVCLAARKNDNITGISALLNLSDGIIGTLVDLRVIITTNRDIKDIDDAILRPGRLCRRIDVGLLAYEQANSVYQRLHGTAAKLAYQRFYALADVYAPPYFSTSEGPSRNTAAIGFRYPAVDTVLNTARRASE